MGIKMVFDERISAFLKGDDGANRCMLRNAEEALNDTLKAKGYMYLNQVYENLEMPWDVRWNNKLYLSEEGVRFVFKNIRKNDSGGYEFEFCVVTE